MEKEEAKSKKASVCMCVCMSVRYWKKAKFNDFVRMSVCKVGVSRSRCTLWIFFQVELKEPPKGTESKVQEVVSLSVCLSLCLSVCVFVCLCACMCVRNWKKVELNNFVCVSVMYRCTLWIFFQVHSEKRPKDPDPDVDDYDVVDETDVPRIKVSVFMCMCVCVSCLCEFA